MKLHKWKDVRARLKLTPEQIREDDEWVRRELVKIELRDLRKLAGRTQAETAAAAKMAQSEISKLERRDDHLLSTLRRYVEALGGELEVVAHLGNKRITLRGV